MSAASGNGGQSHLRRLRQARESLSVEAQEDEERLDEAASKAAADAAFDAGFAEYEAGLSVNDERTGA